MQLFDSIWGILFGNFVSYVAARRIDNVSILCEASATRGWMYCNVVMCRSCPRIGSTKSPPCFCMSSIEVTAFQMSVSPLTVPVFPVSERQHECHQILLFLRSQL